ncbi:MAG TPA: thiamine phosphate synthase [Candidatus Brocadiia bacterium]|nr:thiamine phosphate synthase [Candidatus Brocadiales bacterium]
MFNLLLITDRKISKRPLSHAVKAALEGGVDAVQVREKDLNSRELFEIADELRKLTATYNAKLIINDRVDVALAVDADGVHLGWRSMSIKKVRSLVGPEKLIGYSAHSLHEARNAQEDGADYITFSPIYKSRSKEVTPVGADKIRTLEKHIKIPVIALGGIDEDNVDEVLRNGADGVAVISSILVAENPLEAARKLRRKIEQFKNKSTNMQGIASVVSLPYNDR